VNAHFTKLAQNRFSFLVTESFPLAYFALYKSTDFPLTFQLWLGMVIYLLSQLIDPMFDVQGC